uniref:hypothetical protein n=1 Tax=Zhihengliuella salsuginis TaxID=578222 RepID=UPI0016733033|nr:hypothetical protein [Zhihengliuella salsuginis]
MQILDRAGRQVTDIEHVGSAHTDAELAVLLVSAEERLRSGQGAFDLEGLERTAVSTREVADWTAAGDDAAEANAASVASRGRPSRVAADGRAIASPAVVLWEVLTEAYSRLGADVLEDEGFRAMVLARLIEPTSKADTRSVSWRRSGPNIHLCVPCSAASPAVTSATTATGWPGPCSPTGPGPPDWPG